MLERVFSQDFQRLPLSSNYPNIQTLIFHLKNFLIFLFKPKCLLCNNPSNSKFILCDEDLEKLESRGTVTLKKYNNETFFYIQKYKSPVKELILGSKSNSVLMEKSTRTLFKDSVFRNIYSEKKKNFSAVKIITNIPGSKPALYKPSLSLKLTYDFWDTSKLLHMDTVFLPFSLKIFPLMWVFKKKQSRKSKKERAKTDIKTLNFKELRSNKMIKENLRMLAESSQEKEVEILIIDDILTTAESLKRFRFFLKDHLIKKYGFKKIRLTTLVFAFTEPPTADKT
jgi:predicted amidophosphoribosyltransferase